MAASDGGSSPRRSFHSYVQTVSTCDDILERENAELRAQVHDLTELLAAFDLCELQDGHLKAVRDRAFQRDIAPDRELLQVFRLERWQQQEALSAVLNNNSGDMSKDVHDDISHDHECEFLRQRVDVLERDVGELVQRIELLEGSSSRWGCPDTEAEQLAVDLDKEKQDERVDFQEPLEETAKTIQEPLEETAKTIQELQKRIATLEKAVAAQSAENVLQQKQSRYSKIANALAEF